MKTDIPVIRTKIIIPQRRREIITRPRLLTILDDILELKLLILAAPAGYGKTSLLVDYSKHTQLPVCWLALDPLDNDLKRFATHLIASIHMRFPEFGEDSNSVLATVNQGEMDFDPIVSAMVNDVFDHISEHFVVVLDDYHLVRDSKDVEAFFNRLILEIGENCHFVIASRTLLTLPDLSLLVARSQVGGLSFEELAFLPEEIRQLLEVNYHQQADDGRIGELLEQTEGWITGLLLSTQLSQKDNHERQRVTRVSGIGIYEYLAQQVFDRQPEDIRGFLLRTSLLEEFDVQMCERMLRPVDSRPRAAWQQMIERVLNDNLFVVQVGETNAFLRFHHLFRDFLQNRMRLERPEETEKIEKRLAEFLEDQNQWERAYAIYARQDDTQHIISLIHHAGPDLIAGGRLVTLSEWLNALPSETLDSHPELLSLKGSAYLVTGNIKESLTYFDQAVEKLQNGSQLDLADAYNRRSAALRQMGEFTASMEDAENAIRLSKDRSDLVILLAEALRAKGVLLVEQGKPQEALLPLSESITLFRETNHDMDVAKVLLEQGLAFRKIGQFEETEKAYKQALNVLHANGNAILSANILNNLGVLQYLLGQYEQAVLTLDKAQQYAKIASYPRMEGYTLNSLGDLYRDLGSFTQAKIAYEQAWNVILSVHDKSLEMYQYVSIAAMDRMQGNFISAAENLAKAKQTASAEESSYEAALFSLEEAILSLKQNQKEDIGVQMQSTLRHFINEGHRLEADRTKLALFVSLTERGLLKSAEKICIDLFETPISATSKPALISLGSEFKDTIVNSARVFPNNPGLLEFAAEMVEHQRKLPEIRKALRGKSSIIPNAPAHIVIRTLGKAQVKIGDHLITTAEWRTQMSRDFFLYLVAHPEGATKEEIAEVFWPYSSAEAIRLRFKNTIYRVRRAVGTDAITFVDEYYRFNRSIDYEYDAEEFLNELNAANASNSRPDQIKHLKAAIADYHGIFLPKLDMEWALVLRTQMQHAFMDSLIKLANLYFQADQYQPAIHTANRALIEDPCNEAAHRLIMLAYAAMGSRAEVARQFEKCIAILKRELNVEPAQQTKALYDMLTR
jgi:ATP/maltotriose-dependent transcriptional regulator MalT/two-component SAPR family response regulator